MTLDELLDIEIKGRTGRCDYSGMVKNNKPHGFGRAIDTNKACFIDG